MKKNLPERCFDFDRKSAAGGKRLFLLTSCFYFRVAHFTHRSLLSEVDNKEATGIGRDINSMSQGSGLPYATDIIPKLSGHGYH